MSFIDLHSHVLPGLDDGSPDLDTSLRLIRGLASIGFETIVATPHQKAGQFLPDARVIASALRQTLEALEGAAVGHVTLSLAAENMWDVVFYERCESNSIPTYGESRSFLVEFPLGDLPVGVFDRLFELRTRGWLPVIAHPERYEPLWSSDLASRLGENSALVVDLAALAGYHGRKRAKAARHLVKTGLAHAAASDTHTPGDVQAASEGIAWIRKKCGDRAVRRLLTDAPTQILAGRHPQG